jgi:hypothetical protein
MICPICDGENIQFDDNVYFCNDCGEYIERDDIIFDLIDTINSGFGVLYQNRNYEESE